MSRLIHPSRWVQGTVLLVILLCGWTLVKFAWPTGEVLGKSLDTYLLQLGAPMPKDRESAREVIEQYRERFLARCLQLVSEQPSGLDRWIARMRARVATSRLGRILKVSPPYWDQQKRLMAMRTLGLIQPRLDQVDEVLRSGLRDRDQPFRMEAAKLLASLNPPALEVLEDALEDSDAVVRKAAYYAVYRMGSHAEELTPTLVQCLIKEPQIEPDPLLYEALARMGNRAANELGKRLPEASAPARQRLTKAMIPLGGRCRPYGQWFIEGMRESSPQMRAFSLEAFSVSSWTDQKASEHVFPLLKDEDAMVRLTVLQCMDAHIPLVEDSLEHLLVLLEDQEPEIRRWAQRLIERMPITQTASPKVLSHALESRNLFVRQVASQKLEQLALRK
ncbi:MAG: HEAT repeat domain-containing protein [Limisphaerales bacterium]